MGLSWNERLSVGNEIIDSDHKNLIVVINRLADAIKLRDRAALHMAFELLDSYMTIHFENERKIAKAISFPFDKNISDQQQLLHEIRHMVKELETMDCYWPEHLLDRYTLFLNNWMDNHIIKTDMQMKPALQAYPYDFKPG